MIKKIFWDKVKKYIDAKTKNLSETMKTTLDSYNWDGLTAVTTPPLSTAIVNAGVNAHTAQAEAMTAESYAIEPVTEFVKEYSIDALGAVTFVVTTNRSALYWAAQGGSGGPSGIPEPTADGDWVRKVAGGTGSWIALPDSGIPEAPNNGKPYGRMNNGWQEIIWPDGLLYKDGSESMANGYSPASDYAIATKKYVDGFIKSDPTGIQGANRIVNEVYLTQAAYDAIVTPDASTYYVIAG